MNSLLFLTCINIKVKDSNHTSDNIWRIILFLVAHKLFVPPSAPEVAPLDVAFSGGVADED